MNPQEFLSYDRNTGIFTWKINRNSYGGKAKAGARAGYLCPRTGYRVIRLRGRLVREHRLAWFMIYGRWPPLLDHINGDRSDNRLENLREASISENLANSNPRRGNARGVWLDGQTSKWRVQVKKEGRTYSPGRFRSESDAAVCYNYHAAYLYGEFSRLNAIKHYGHD